LAHTADGDESTGPQVMPGSLGDKENYAYQPRKIQERFLCPAFGIALG
jgi:hypothetical protein